MFRNKKIYILIVSILIIFIVLILYSKDVSKLGIIKNKKQAINEAIGVTTIDVTGIELGKETDHTHLFKTMYDENKHWEECTKCGEKKNEGTHSLKRTWALLTESCSENNTYKDTCECGYYVQGHRPCVWNGQYITESNHWHYKKCSQCSGKITRSYYLNTYGKGQLYQSTGPENCVLSNGSRLTCNVTGTCKICKYYFSQKQHALTKRIGNEIYCSICNQKYATFTEEIIRDNNTPGTYTIINKVNLFNGAQIYESVKGKIRDDETLWQTNTQTVSNKNSAGTQFTLTSVGKIKDTFKTYSYTPYTYFYVTINGVPARTQLSFFTVYSDLVKPTITQVTTENEEELTQWSRTKPIIITGTENWTNTVKVEIIDEEENVIFSGRTTVTNKNYSISCTPELEVDARGKTFKLIITDECLNTAEQEFTISKVDAIAPKINSGDELGGDWAREKNFTFTATDYGIGNVKIGFNDIKDYALANKDEENYSREYKFIGDVYKPREANVYYKDELGNIAAKKIILDKLDNTAPTISSVDLHNNKLTIESHDRHETEGEGSGVVKYRYLASTEKLVNPDLTPENVIEVNKDEEITIKEIYNVKYIYIVAEDYVGNISKVYELEVPPLVLTSKVNLSTTNGKGEILLDWSSYDITDKYFVIYRKKENEEEWQQIVSIEDKLTGNTYTDTLANDEAKPNVPTININANQENNNINVTATSTDSGSRYKYYIESYDANNLSLLNISNK